MAENVSGKGQNFFHRVSLEGDGAILLQQLAKTHSLVEVKGDTSADASLFTTLETVQVNGATLLGKYSKGPQLGVTSVTMMFNLEKDKFFASGKVATIKNADHVIVIDKLFKLQRRDFYRVSLPKSIIKAEFFLTKVNEYEFTESFRVADLSTGGMRLLVGTKSTDLFETGAAIKGSLEIGTYGPLDISGIVKYRRKTNEDGTPGTSVGCQFTKNSGFVSQKISFIVNDCHRQIYLRTNK